MAKRSRRKLTAEEVAQLIHDKAKMEGRAEAEQEIFELGYNKALEDVAAFAGSPLGKPDSGITITAKVSASYYELDIADEEFGLEQHTSTYLRQGGIETVGQLVELTEAQLREIRFVRDTRVAEIITCLEAKGLSLREAEE